MPLTNFSSLTIKTNNEIRKFKKQSNQWRVNSTKKGTNQQQQQQNKVNTDEDVSSSSRYYFSDSEINRNEQLNSTNYDDISHENEVLNVANKFSNDFEIRKRPKNINKLIWKQEVLDCAKRGDLPLMRRHLFGLRTSTIRRMKDDWQNNLWHYTAKYNRLHCLQWLCALKDGQEPLIERNKDGMSAVAVAIKRGSLEVVQWLTKHTIIKHLISPSNQDERSLLHIAAKYGSLPLINWLSKYMLINGHSLNQRDKYMYTALHLVAKYNNIDCIQILVLRGIDIMAKDFQNKKAEDLARHLGYKTCADYLNALESYIKVSEDNVLLNRELNCLKGEIKEIEKCFEDLLQLMKTNFDKSLSTQTRSEEMRKKLANIELIEEKFKKLNFYDCKQNLHSNQLNFTVVNKNDYENVICSNDEENRFKFNKCKDETDYSSLRDLFEANPHLKEEGTNCSIIEIIDPSSESESDLKDAIIVNQFEENKQTTQQNNNCKQQLNNENKPEIDETTTVETTTTTTASGSLYKDYSYRSLKWSRRRNKVKSLFKIPLQKFTMKSKETNNENENGGSVTYGYGMVGGLLNTGAGTAYIGGNVKISTEYTNQYAYASHNKHFMNEIDNKDSDGLLSTSNISKFSKQVNYVNYKTGENFENDEQVKNNNNKMNERVSPVQSETSKTESALLHLNDYTKMDNGKTMNTPSIIQNTIENEKLTVKEKLSPFNGDLFKLVNEENEKISDSGFETSEYSLKIKKLHYLKKNGANKSNKGYSLRRRKSSNKPWYDLSEDEEELQPERYKKGDKE